MFPFRDHNPSSRTPFVTYGLILANVVIFLAYQPLFANDQALGAFFSQWAAIPAAITQGDALHGLVTSMFLHGGWMHLIGNMLFLYVFGDNLEDIMGHLAYLGFYLLCGLAAALAQVITSPDSTIPLVGASGAIAGVMGGYMLLFPKARVDVLFIIIVLIFIRPISAWIVLGVWFAIQVFSGVSTPSAGGGVAFWAHAGGFVVGLGLTAPFWLARGGPEFWHRTHGHPAYPEARYSRSSLPVISRRGIQAQRQGSAPTAQNKTDASPWGKPSGQTPPPASPSNIPQVRRKPRR
ncbi:MAG: rhomboid family intramembrane serine protease [Mangrovicoccus sp.]|nr:rhomboid family intramembrane serine protease [Mangrovicoccus sp.]